MLVRVCSCNPYSQSSCLSVLGGSVSGLSGQGVNGVTNTCEVYDAGAWRSLPRMKQARADLAVVTDGDVLYAIGGVDASGKK